MSGLSRSKAWGREVENAALWYLRAVFPKLRRTGSVAYKKAAPDLVQDGGEFQGTLFLVVTRDKRRPLLITMNVIDFVGLIQEHPELNVRVQVKGRESTWIGRLYDELRDNS